MEVNVIFKTARCVTLEMDDGSVYESDLDREIYINGSFYKKTRRVIDSVYGLKPDTEYAIRVKAGEETEITVKTDYEFVTLDVRDFGAKGDGVSDDTHERSKEGSGTDTKRRLSGHQSFFEKRPASGAGRGGGAVRGY